MKTEFPGIVQIGIVVRDIDRAVARYESLFLNDRGPGLHHVMLATEDYVASLADFEQKGHAVVASGELQQTRFALLDTVEDLGMLIELADGGPLVPDGTSGSSRLKP